MKGRVLTQPSALTACWRKPGQGGWQHLEIAVPALKPPQLGLTLLRLERTCAIDQHSAWLHQALRPCSACCRCRPASSLIWLSCLRCGSSGCRLIVPVAEQGASSSTASHSPVQGVGEHVLRPHLRLEPGPREIGAKPPEPARRRYRRPSRCAPLAAICSVLPPGAAQRSSTFSAADLAQKMRRVSSPPHPAPTTRPPRKPCKLRHGRMIGRQTQLSVRQQRRAQHVLPMPGSVLDADVERRPCGMSEADQPRGFGAIGLRPPLPQPARRIELRGIEALEQACSGLLRPSAARHSPDPRNATRCGPPWRRAPKDRSRHGPACRETGAAPRQGSECPWLRPICAATACPGASSARPRSRPCGGKQVSRMLASKRAVTGRKLAARGCLRSTASSTVIFRSRQVRKRSTASVRTSAPGAADGGSVIPTGRSAAGQRHSTDRNWS